MTEETENKEVVTTNDIVEEDKSDKLSNRDALEAAISEKRQVSEEAKPIATEQNITNKEIKQAVDADIQPPAEFSAAGKKAWAEKNLSEIQKEYARIHTARTQEITRAQRAEREAREDAKTWRELGKMAAPYIEARGQQGVTPQQAMMEALALIQEIKKGDPSSIKSELKKIGIDLDSQNSHSSTAKNFDDSKINTLQERLERLESERENQRIQTLAITYDNVFKKVISEKTRTGETVFPDLLDNSEKGIEFAKELGSLTQDQRFQAGVLRRFPDADLSTVVKEAYKYLGGKVAGESVTVSPENNTTHIVKSRRAAASTPGGIVKRNDPSSLIGKLSARAALARALEEQQEH